MSFADHYFVRYKALPPFFNDKPEETVEIIVIIPCLDDEFIFQTLASLEYANTVCAKIEVIVHVNSGEQTPIDVVERNNNILNELIIKAQEGYYKNFRLLPMSTKGTIRKKAGVGFARKTAMDEAVRRFASIDKPDGLIVSLDADTLVDKDYFQEITGAMNVTKANCFTFQFRHHFDASVYPENVINACRLYEIYLRYYRLALKMFDFPFAIHTIGSCFAIRAQAYIKLGGMPPRQGGEDFYFLQKAVKMNPVYEVRKPIVFPSPRVSDRVPFGTGPSVQSIIAKGKYEVYNCELFGLLKDFYSLIRPQCHSRVGGDPPDRRLEPVEIPLTSLCRKGRGVSVTGNEGELKWIPQVIIDFIGINRFEAVFWECKKYSSSPDAFVKRMFDHFDSFFIVKFLNSFNQSEVYPPMDILEAASIILRYYGVYDIYDLYEQIMIQDINT